MIRWEFVESMDIGESEDTHRHENAWIRCPERQRFTIFGRFLKFSHIRISGLWPMIFRSNYKLLPCIVRTEKRTRRETERRRIYLNWLNDESGCLSIFFANKNIEIELNLFQLRSQQVHQDDCTFTHSFRRKKFPFLGYDEQWHAKKKQIVKKRDREMRNNKHSIDSIWSVCFGNEWIVHCAQYHQSVRIRWETTTKKMNAQPISSPSHLSLSLSMARNRKPTHTDWIDEAEFRNK